MSRRCLGCMEMFGDEFELCPHCGYAVGTMAEEAIHIQPGTILHNRYIIGKVLGYGGFGVTYIGWDGKLEQKVAIKEYLPSEFSTRMPGQTQITVFNGEKSQQFHDGLMKFVEEAKRLAKFTNEPGIVRIFDAFQENETAYIVMEYLEGETLTSYLEREGIVPEEKAVEMLLPVMMSLQAVHEEGIVHRDIAPDNIFLTNNGEVKLIDFGASRYATTTHSRSITVIIKPGYSPEEQYRSRGDQGPHTDVYALGATLYKMVTGKTPPDAMERRAKFENQNKDILVRPGKYNKKLSVDRETAILNSLNIRIEDRTPDLGTFIEELTSGQKVKRRDGKIRKIDIYRWPLWLKIALGTIAAGIITLAVLLLTGVISFSHYVDEVIIPEGVTTAPDVEGLYSDKAFEEISACNLLASTAGNVESDYIPAGKIVLQDPVGGTHLDEMSVIALTVSSGQAVQEPVDGIATIPYVIWDTQEDALSKLERAGLGTPDIEEVNDENVDPGRIVSQSLQAGEKVDVGTVITLEVSLGPSEFEMPDFVGKEFETARKALMARGIAVTFEYDKSNDVEEGQVISQSVNGGDMIKHGQTVHFIVCSGKKTIEVANVAGLEYNQAVKQLKSAGFTVTVLENYDENVEKGYVISQTPAAGTMQLKGSNITLYVSKGKQPVMVYFDGNGGSVSTGSQEFFYKDYYKGLPSATREGYNFDGWYTSPDGGGHITSSSMVTSSTEHTLYAHWTPATFTVSFDGNGGSVSGSSSISVTYGGTYDGLPTAEKADYAFAGWYTSPNGGSSVSEGSQVTATGNHTLYAHWNRTIFTVQFDGNGGTISGSTAIKVKVGGSYGSLPTAKKDYCTFTGWATSSGSAIREGQAVSLTDDITVYAQWKDNAPTDWVPKSKVPSDGKVVETQYTYDVVSKTTSNSESMSGWTCYDKKATGYGDYGAWSNWSTNAVKESDSRKVETKQDSKQTLVGYNMSSFLTRAADGSTYRRYTSYLPSSRDSVYGYFDHSGYVSLSQFNSMPSVAPGGWSSGSGGAGYNGDSKTGYSNGDGVIMFISSEKYDTTTTTYYRYADRTVTYTYYFSKTETKESTSYPSGEGVTNIQEWARYIPK